MQEQLPIKRKLCGRLKGSTPSQCPGHWDFLVAGNLDAHGYRLSTHGFIRIRPQQFQGLRLVTMQPGFRL